MNSDDLFLLNRFKDLADRSYNKNIYTYSAFLTLAEAEVFYHNERELGYAHGQLLGGVPGAERRILRFGSAEQMGYEEPLPIKVVRITPAMKKFADELTHRDYLGALLNLGIERELLGDFIITEDAADIIVLERAAEFICNELTRIKRTVVKTEIIDIEDYQANLPEPTFEEISETVTSERADLIIAKVTKLSRSQVLELFSAKLIAVNGKILENNSASLKAGDVFTVRGHGKFRYDGVNYTNKKGKFNITVSKYT